MVEAIRRLHVAPIALPPSTTPRRLCKDSTTVLTRIFQAPLDRCEGGWAKVVLCAHGVELYDVCVYGAYRGCGPECLRIADVARSPAPIGGGGVFGYAGAGILLGVRGRD